MKNYIQDLKNCKLFTGIKAEELSAMLECLSAKISDFDKNKNVLKEGTILHQFGVLLEGKIQFVQYDYFGNRNILSTLLPFQIFGEAFSYVNTNLPFNVETVEKSKILFLNSTKLATPCHNNCLFHKKLINNLLYIIANKNVEMTQKVECMSKRTTKEKIMAFLNIESVKNNSREFEITLDRQSLADYLGVERSAMSAEISKLRKEKVIECDKNKFKILW